MAFTYDPTTDRGKVRLLIHDTDSGSILFQDAEIDAFLLMRGSNWYGAAADALRSLAASKALIAKAVTAGKYSESSEGLPSKLLDVAEKLDELAKGNIEPAEAHVEMAETTFQSAEFLVKQVLRGQL